MTEATGSTYATEQLGGQGVVTAFSRDFGGRLSPAGSGQPISYLLGGAYLGNISPSSGERDFSDVLSFSEARSNSALSAYRNNYLEGLITDNEIDQIRIGNETLMSRLLGEYVFEDAVKVRSFLQDHPSVPSVLLDAAPFLRDSFGSGAVLQLQIPPEEDVPLTICAVALWSGNLESAREALKKFDRSWSAENGYKASGRIVFDYQLV